jgi:hypothetical protein
LLNQGVIVCRNSRLPRDCVSAIRIIPEPSIDDALRTRYTESTRGTEFNSALV